MPVYSEADVMLNVALFHNNSSHSEIKDQLVGVVPNASVRLRP